MSTRPRNLDNKIANIMSLQFSSPSPSTSKPPQSIPATELKNRLGAVIQSAIKNKRDVIVSSRGVPQVAIVPFEEWQKLDEIRHQQEQAAERQKALQTWAKLRKQIRARNQDLTEAQAQQLA